MGEAQCFPGLLALVVRGVIVKLNFPKETMLGLTGYILPANQSNPTLHEQYEKRRELHMHRDDSKKKVGKTYRHDKSIQKLPIS
jgi:hypothetical protein